MQVGAWCVLVTAGPQLISPWVVAGTSAALALGAGEGPGHTKAQYPSPAASWSMQATLLFKSLF